MVVLSPNFAVLASLSVLAATLLAPVNGVAIPNPPRHSQADRHSGEAAKFDKHRSDSSSSAQSQSALSETDATNGDGSILPPIPLPNLGRRLQHTARGQPLSKRWDPLDPLVEFGGLYIGDNPNHDATAQTEVFEVASANSRVHSTSERVKTEHRHPEENVHMIITGDNENIHMRRSPRPHSHHHPTSNAIVDDVHLSAKRVPHTHLHHGSHRYHWKRDINDQEKREYEISNGVPGVIDITSSVADSKIGQKIASLVLAFAPNGTNSSTSFVLNASGTNQTQVYLVVLDDDDSSNSGTFDPHGQTSSTSHANSTMPSNSTTSEGSTAPVTQAIDASTSMPFGTSASASIASSSSTDSPNSTSVVKKVALKIPVFNRDEADLNAFCATFDPQPSAPSPLTVESCIEGVLQEDHKSQVFAYDPSTGIIQPMWFTGGGNSTAQDDAGTTQDNSESSSSTSTPTDDASATGIDSIDASADVGGAVARLNNLDRELVGDASSVHNFAARDSYNAHNVTLVFTPLVPVLPQQDSPTEVQAVDPFASSSSSAVPTATDSSSSAIATDSASLTSSIAPSSISASGFTTSTVSEAMTSAGFSPAAAPSSTPTDAVSGSLSASSTGSDVYSSASATGSGSAMLSATASAAGSAATPTSSAHGLGVEVFDPSVQASSEDADSSSGVSSTSQSSTTAGATSTASSGSAGAPSMTPMSTEPYNWMFRRTTGKN